MKSAVTEARGWVAAAARMLKGRGDVSIHFMGKRWRQGCVDSCERQPRRIEIMIDHATESRDSDRRSQEPSSSKRSAPRTSVLRVLSLLLSSALVTATVRAAASRSEPHSSRGRTSLPPSGEPMQERPKPPQAAFDACNGKAEGDACSVQLGERKISGTCQSAPGGEKALLCFPAGAPRSE